MITLALRRANQNGKANILEYIPEGITLLPNTSGARNADEAVRIARRVAACGVTGIWNFTNVELPQQEMPDVRVEDVHFADSLLTLSYMISEESV